MIKEEKMTVLALLGLFETTAKIFFFLKKENHTVNLTGYQ